MICSFHCAIFCYSFFGGDKEIRTPDPLLARQVLSQLSYAPILNNKNRIVNFLLLRKEVIQPHLPIRLPCYDFTPVTKFTLGSFLLRWLTDFGCPQLPWCDGRCVQDPGTHSPRHSDSRLLVTPASCGRVSAHNPNLDHFYQICSTLQFRFSL